MLPDVSPVVISQNPSCIDSVIIGSTRSKGSGTSSALSELTRRREEKNKVRSKRHHRDSPSPDRKRRRRHGDQSDYEYSGEEYNDSEEETEKKVNESLSTRSSMILKWHCFRPKREHPIWKRFNLSLCQET